MGKGPATEGEEAREVARGEGRKVDRMWWRLWTVEVRVEFWILEEKNEGGAGGSGGKRLTSCSVLAWDPVQAMR